LEKECQETGRSARDKAGYTKHDRYAVHVRSFSHWLQQQGRRNIASRLNADFNSLEADLDLFYDNPKKRSLVQQIRSTLKRMRNMFSSEFAMTGTGPDGFVPEQAAQHMGQMPTQTPSPYHLSPMTPGAFPNFSGLEDPSEYSLPSRRSGSVHPGTDSIYGGLGSLGSAAHYGSSEAHPDTPQEVTQRPHTDSPFQDLSLSSLNSAAHYGSHGAAYPSTPSEVTGPSHAGQPLPTGPMRGSLNSVLTQLNLERGFASGDALNCLIDTALQLSHGVRRPDNGQTPMPQLDQTVPAWRQHLFVADVVPQHGMIDLYSANLAGANLAHNLGVRIQIIQWENGRATAHPVLGRRGPLVHILHTPGHFQPLWSRNG